MENFLLCAVWLDRPASFTAGLEFNDIGGWWDEPILYQLMIWTVLMEILRLAATCGPMAFHFDPPIGQSLYWWQNDTLRIRRTQSCSVDEGQPPHPMGHRPLQAHRVLACDDAVPFG